MGAPGWILGKAVQPLHPPTGEGYAWGNGWSCPLLRPHSTSCSAPGPSPLLVATPGWVWASGWPLVMDQLSLSMFSSNTMVVARAFQWASLTSVSSLLAKVPCLPLHEVLFHNGWVSTSSNSPHPLSSLSSFCLRWSFKEDTMPPVSSPAHCGPHGRDVGYLLSLYTWW